MKPVYSAADDDRFQGIGRRHLIFQMQRQKISPDLFAEAKATDDGKNGQRGPVQTEPIGEAWSTGEFYTRRPGYLAARTCIR